MDRQDLHGPPSGPMRCFVRNDTDQVQTIPLPNAGIAKLGPGRSMTLDLTHQEAAQIQEIMGITSVKVVGRAEGKIQ